MGITHYNNQYAADYMESPDYSAAVGGNKNKKRRYKGGMNELTPASFRGFAGCANWAGGKRRRSRKLRRKSYKGGIQRSTTSNIILGKVSYEDNLSGGKRRMRKTRKLRKSRKQKN